MDPITAPMELAQFAPQIGRWITNSDKDANVAPKEVDLATWLTGKPTPALAHVERLPPPPTAKQEI